MKKALIAATLISGLTLSSFAMAYPGAGEGRPMANCGYANTQQLDPEVQAKIDQYRKDTQDLRRQMVVKHAEKKAMMKRTNPDPAAVGQVTGEIFDLHTTMVEKAKEAGVEQYVGHGKRKNARMGCARMGKGHHGKGFSRGHGHGHHGWKKGDGPRKFQQNRPMQQQQSADQI